jgi:hypothetical protein
MDKIMKFLNFITSRRYMMYSSKLKHAAIVGLSLVSLGFAFPQVASAASVSGYGITGSSTSNGGIFTGSENQFTVQANDSGSGAQGVLTSIASYPINGVRTSTGSIAKIECLSVSGNKVYFSGTETLSTPDPRQNNAQNNQVDDAVKNNRYLVAGYFIDKNNPDARSLFFSADSVQQVDVGNAGPDNVSSVSPAFFGATGVDLCKKQDAIFVSADYYRTSNGKIQWLNSKGSPLGAPVDNTVQNLTNPPSKSIYSLAKETRDFVVGDITLVK